LYQIVDKHSRFVTFKPNRIQQLVTAERNPKVMILKARQLGITTHAMIQLLDQTIYTKNFTGCVLAHESDAIKKIFRIPRRAYNAMEHNLKPALDKGGGSMYEMNFPSLNSRMYCDLESRGDTISKLHISEAAFIPYERFVSTMQAVPIGGSVAIESTPNGIGNWFYEMWNDPSNGYAKLFFPWFFDPAYAIAGPRIRYEKEERDFAKFVLKKYGITITDDQIRFRRAKQAEIKDAFLQEYPEDDQTCFLLSGGLVCDRRFIGDLLKRVAEPIEKLEHIEIFKRRSNHGTYVIGADCAQGVGNDWSVAVCLDAATREEVAIFRAQMSPFQFARALKSFADLFSAQNRIPLIAVESNNHGHAVLQELHEHIGYPRLYCSKKDTLGWATNSVTRPIMMNQFIDAVTSETITLHSKETLREMLTLVNNNGKIEAATGRHDDCVIATAIAVQMLVQASAKADLYKNSAKAILV